MKFLILRRGNFLFAVLLCATEEKPTYFHSARDPSWCDAHVRLVWRQIHSRWVLAGFIIIISRTFVFELLTQFEIDLNSRT